MPSAQPCCGEAQGPALQEGVLLLELVWPCLSSHPRSDLCACCNGGLGLDRVAAGLGGEGLRAAQTTVIWMAAHPSLAGAVSADPGQEGHLPVLRQSDTPLLAYASGTPACPQSCAWALN